MVPARSLQKSYKTIIESVKNKKKPVVLTTNNKPQAALVSMEDLKRIQEEKYRQGVLDMLRFAREHAKELKGKLPPNLREIADDILYSKP